MNKYYEQLISPFVNEKEYYAAIKEYFTSVEDVIKPEDYPDELFQKLVTPNNIITFDVKWVDDKGVTQVNKGYRVQFNNAIGPYKGGLRFHPSVNLSILKMLAFEQIYKNALTTLPMGGGKGGSDFDPKGKSEEEVKRFCLAFVEQLAPYMSIDRDVPAGDIGVGGREIRYMYEEYKRLTGRDDGALTGKPLDLGGSLCRPEATGYGLCYITNKMLDDLLDDSFKGKTVVISGSGNVAMYACKKAYDLGAKVLAMSDSNNAVYDPNGINYLTMKRIKEEQRGRVREYVEVNKDAVLMETKDIWSVKADIYLPCATQFEIDEEAAAKIIAYKPICVCEGSNKSTTRGAVEMLQNAGIHYLPGKAANAGGVAVSGLEMEQNIKGEHWSFEKVDNRLKEIMETIYSNIKDNASTLGNTFNFVKGANVAGFKIVVKKMGY